MIRAISKNALALGAAASVLAALYFWRSRRPTEPKTYAVTLIAAMNFALAAALPTAIYKDGAARVGFWGAAAMALTAAAGHLFGGVL